jgi:hypothetical protein
MRNEYYSKNKVRINKIEKEYNLKIDKKYLNKIEWNIFNGDMLKVI